MTETCKSTIVREKVMILGVEHIKETYTSGFDNQSYEVYYVHNNNKDLLHREDGKPAFQEDTILHSSFHIFGEHCTEEDAINYSEVRKLEFLKNKIHSF